MLLQCPGLIQNLMLLQGVHRVVRSPVYHFGDVFREQVTIEILPHDRFFRNVVSELCVLEKS